jgi:MFS family permease
MMVILLIVGMGAWPASYVVAAETSSLRLRARTQGVAGCAANLVTGIFSIVLPYLYNPDQGKLGGKIGFIFGAFCAIGVFCTWILIPEMKNRTPAEIDEMFEMRLKTRDFEKHR